MNYIYDVLINFKYPLYDFFEWNRNDNIMNIKKTPLFKVKTYDLNIMKYNKFKINNILDNVYNKTVVYTNRKKKSLNYAFILSDGFEAIGFLFNNKGICIGKSKILLDEELDILSSLNELTIKEIKYDIIRKDIVDEFKTRNELIKRKFIINELNHLDSLDKINYLYYECFNSYNNSSKDEIIRLLDSKWDEISNKIYDFLQLISMNKE